MNYRPDIDGLRAVAVLSVLFYHAHLGFPGGYVGVDIFFVISGYLISGIILRSLASGTFSYRDFWERRIRRLIPALALMTLVVGAASCVILIPDDLLDLAGALIAQPLLLSNVYFWRVVKGGYFGDPPEMRPLLHTWSLGVEEQFYLLFPLLLLFLWRYTVLRTRLRWLLLGLSLVSLVLGIFLTPVKPVFAFFNLPTRAWELLWGALLHFVPASKKSLFLKGAWSFLGLILILGSIFTYTGSMEFPGTAAIVPVFGTMLLIWAGEGTWIGRGLSHPSMVFIGKISYSLYLWHWPVMAWTAYFGKLQTVEVKCLTILVSLGLGYLSWRWVETPVRQNRVLAGKRGLGAILASYLVGTSVLVATILVSNGFSETWSVETGKSTNEFHRRYIYEYREDESLEALPSLGDSEKPRASFLLWGDSHAMALASAFDELGKKYHVRGIQLTASSTPPLISVAPHYRERTQEFLDAWRQEAARILSQPDLKAVFLHATWAGYAYSETSTDFRETARWIRANAQNPDLRIIFVQDVPVFNYLPLTRQALLARWSHLEQTVMISPAAHRERNAEVEKALNEVWRDDRLDPAQIILKWKSVRRDRDGEPLYHDRGHLTDYGALELKPFLEPIFSEVVNGSSVEP